MLYGLFLYKHYNYMDSTILIKLTNYMEFISNMEVLMIDKYYLLINIQTYIDLEKN